MWFILVRAKKCPTSSGGGEFCIILHRSAYIRGYKRMWERKELPSLKVREESVGVCDSAGALARSRRVICLCLALCCCGGCPFFPPLEWSLHAPFIVSRRCRVTKCWNVVWPWLVEPKGLRRALSGGNVVSTVEAWRWNFWHCCYVSRHVHHCWGVVSVFWCCSDVPCHTWSYSRCGVFVLVVWLA
jgi:hypothetical protein